jgi:hypothetical protein
MHSYSLPMYCYCNGLVSMKGRGERDVHRYVSQGVDEEVMLYVLWGVISIQKPMNPSTDRLSCTLCVPLLNVFCTDSSHVGSNL